MRAAFSRSKMSKISEGRKFREKLSLRCQPDEIHLLKMMKVEIRNPLIALTKLFHAYHNHLNGILQPRKMNKHTKKDLQSCSLLSPAQAAMCQVGKNVFKSLFFLNTRIQFICFVFVTCFLRLGYYQC